MPQRFFELRSDFGQAIFQGGPHQFDVDGEKILMSKDVAHTSDLVPWDGVSLIPELGRETIEYFAQFDDEITATALEVFVCNELIV